MMHKNIFFISIFFLTTSFFIKNSDEVSPKSSIKVQLPPKKIAEDGLKNRGYTPLVEHSNLIEKMYEKKLTPLQFATVVRQAYFQHDEHFNITLFTQEEQKQRNLQRHYLFFLMLGRSDALGELYSMGLYRPIYFK